MAIESERPGQQRQSPQSGSQRSRRKAEECEEQSEARSPFGQMMRRDFPHGEGESRDRERERGGHRRRLERSREAHTSLGALGSATNTIDLRECVLAHVATAGSRRNHRLARRRSTPARDCSRAVARRSKLRHRVRGQTLARRTGAAFFFAGAAFFFAGAAVFFTAAAFFFAGAAFFFAGAAFFFAGAPFPSWRSVEAIF